MGAVKVDLKVILIQVVDLLFFLIVAELVGENTRLLQTVHHSYAELVYRHV